MLLKQVVDCLWSFYGKGHCPAWNPELVHQAPKGTVRQMKSKDYPARVSCLSSVQIARVRPMAALSRSLTEPTVEVLNLAMPLSSHLAQFRKYH